MKSKYEIQAETFLKEHNIKFSVKFINCAPHFIGETDSRDNFKVTFRRNLIISQTGTNRPEWMGKLRSFTLHFGQSLNETTGNGDNKPSAYDVLASLEKDDVGSFEGFCGEFDYDVDSIKALKIYKAVCKEVKKVNMFFTNEEIEELREIQ